MAPLRKVDEQESGLGQATSGSGREIRTVVTQNHQPEQRRVPEAVPLKDPLRELNRVGRCWNPNGPATSEPAALRPLGAWC